MRGLSLASCILFWAGCSGGDPPPPAHGVQLKTPSYTIAAGEEKYLCYVVPLAETADVAVTAFESFASAHVHHLELFQTLGNEPEGLSECSGTIKINWMPLFGGGQNAGGLQLPDGAGFKLPKDATLLVQLHLLNASSAAVTEKAILNLDYAADATQVMPAGIFAFGSMNINLEPGQTQQVVSSCSLPKALNVFAVQPHMHTLGTKLTFELGADQPSAQMVYSRDPWSFGAQPIDVWNMPMTQGQFGRATCTFDNTTDHAVTYGESTSNEMCYLVLFYTPFDRLGGCIQ